MESDIIARSIEFFVLGRIWNLLWNLLWNSLRNFLHWVLSKLTSQNTDTALVNSNHKFTNLNSGNVKDAWAVSVPKIQWILKENVEYNPYYMERTLITFLHIMELPTDCEPEAVLPLALERIVGAVQPTLESGVSNPTVVKLLIPPIIADPHFGISEHRFKNICKHVMSQHISCKFEIMLELHKTNELREELEKRRSLPPAQDEPGSD